ncbi:hypothetical protein KC345_g11185, partial [Hortaea werneckii]
MITAIFGGLQFYAPFTLAVAAGLAVYAVISIFDLPGLRIRRISLAAFAGICLLATAGHEIKQAYDHSFTVIKEQEVNLYEYAPFTANTKAVALNHAAVYQVRGELPRLDGATALYPLYSAFVQAVYPEDHYNVEGERNDIVQCSSTSEAYKRLIRGHTDIIFAAAPSLAQTKQAKLAGRELKLTPIGREA